jgi:hypothetical protein
LLLTLFLLTLKFDAPGDVILSEQFSYKLKCLCEICRLVAVAEVWGLEAAFPIAQIHAWLAIDLNSAGLHPV